MQNAHLGDLVVGRIGLGAMTMAGTYTAEGTTDDTESIRTIHRALELGVTHIDTAEGYGPFHSEEIVGKAIKGRRDQVQLATKFGILKHDDDGNWGMGPDGSAANVRRAIEGSLKRLSTDYIDLFYQHRMDPKTPIEDTVGALAELVAEGKIRNYGLSEAGAATIRRAHAVHPLAAVQSEFSLFARDVLHNGEKATMDELGIGFVAFSPLGRGFLTGAIRSTSDLDPDDARLGLPRFQPDAIAANLALVDRVNAIASERGVTNAQIALAWLVAQGVVPIPGTRHRTRLDENAAAARVTLTASDLARLSDALPDDEIVGTRDYVAHASGIDR